jgi:hypothetical protein
VSLPIDCFKVFVGLGMVELVIQAHCCFQLWMSSLFRLAANLVGIAWASGSLLDCVRPVDPFWYCPTC